MERPRPLPPAQLKLSSGQKSVRAAAPGIQTEGQEPGSDFRGRSPHPRGTRSGPGAPSRGRDVFT